MYARPLIRTTISIAGSFLLLGGALSAPTFAQAFTHADSGWVRLFNGNDFTGFYSRNYGNVQPVRPPGSPYQIQFAGTDTATIRVNGTSPGGNIGTDDTTFSHYRLRWESKYDAINSNSNSGLTYHVDEKVIRMQNNWPRSIEFQGKQSEIGSAFSIQQVTFTSRASSTSQGANYVATGGTVIQACEYGCNGRWYKGNPLIPPYATATPTVPRWLRFELVARGADSAIHIVNDTTVMRLWNIRIFNDSTKTSGGTTTSGGATNSNMTPNKPWDHGGLGWQSEGAIVNYRRLEVMRIPPTTPMNEHYLHRLFLDEPRDTSVMPGSAHQIRWRSIGTIPKVKIEYRYTSPEGNWVTVTDSAPNTGVYDWTAPTQPQGLAKAASTVYTMRLRISGAGYVWSDSSHIGVVYGVGVLSAPLQGKQSFSVPGNGIVLSALSADTRIVIETASGKRIRELAVGEGNLVWDLKDATGSKVAPGLYFMRARVGKTVYRSGRALVF